MTRKLLLSVFLLVVSVMMFVQCSRAPKTITIIHHNDFHAANSAYEMKMKGEKVPIMGAAGLTSLAKAVEDTTQPNIWLNAGDEYSGGVLSTLTNGYSQFALASKIGYDVMTLGNHEFDYGWLRAKAFVDSSGIPVLGGANLVFEEDGAPFTRTHLDTVIGDVPMRIIGLSPPNLKYLTAGDNIVGLKVLDQVEAVRKYLPPKGRLCIVLSHMGIGADKKLAAAVPEIDLILGGHSHTTLNVPILVNTEGEELPLEELHGKGNKRLPGVLIAQAGASGRYLGVINLKTLGGDIIAAYGQLLRNDGSKVEPDRDVAGFVQEMDDKFAPEMKKQIATVKKALTRGKYTDETPMGRWAADALKEACPADIAIQNPGGLRKDIDVGPVTLQDFWEMAPFDNTLIVFKATGEEVIQMCDYIAANPGESMLVSGLSATIDLGAKKASDFKVNGKPIDKNKTYSLVTNSYLFSSFEKNFGFEKGEREFYDSGIAYRDAFIDAAKKQKDISPPTNTRFTYKK